jgi:hypothetical protein
MPYVIVHTFSGGTKQQYEAAIAEVHPGRDVLPKGMISQFAGPSADGWTIVATSDSKASWEKFRDEILLPTFSKGIKGGFTAPPEEIAFEAQVEIHT